MRLVQQSINALAEDTALVAEPARSINRYTINGDNWINNYDHDIPNDNY